MSDFDPVTLEILWSRLIAITDESAAALVRTSFSTIVRESNDYATVLMNADGDALAENTAGIPSFVGILPRTLKHMLARIPAGEWRPGDCVITNDPWMATGHLPDITMAAPIFHRGRLVGFSGSIAHSPDIGGSLWSADCRELYEEGLRILPVKFLRAGEPNRDLFDMIASNVRLPEQVLGDLWAQVTAQQVLARRLTEFLDDAGMPDLRALSRTLHERAEHAMRKAIEAVPDGDYRSTILADGFDADETRIECRVAVHGSELLVDYAGTSRQIDRGLNSVMNYTYAYTVYPIKCALDPLTPRNEGSYRPVAVTAPEGSILNPRFPAPCNARQLTGHLLAGAVYACLAQAIPDRVIAECGSAPSLRALFSGVDARGQRFTQILFASGGMGATAEGDGLSTTAFPTNSGAGSIEAFESLAPVVVWKKEYRMDSGGAGRHRGGLGQEIVIEVRSPEPVRLSLLADRQKYPARGLRGGGDGAPVEIALADGRQPHQKSRTMLAPGDRLILKFAGGGGFGDPRQRDPAAVREDVENGLVSREAARRDHGVE
ncbi:MAG: hydantoinase B/oxoprolinase family protein [Candidatus Rokubacteria bacterium]|nr:hydantoinase B/oxoprolinase family protein [Candidatus Rokubacteria bacterium]